MVADLRARTAAWLGLGDFAHALDGGAINLSGDPTLSRTFTHWIGRAGLAER